MTKPLTCLLFLFGGAMAAGTGLLGYGEWLRTQQPSVAVAPERLAELVPAPRLLPRGESTVPNSESPGGAQQDETLAVAPLAGHEHSASVETPSATGAPSDENPASQAPVASGQDARPNGLAGKPPTAPSEEAVTSQAPTGHDDARPNDLLPEPPAPALDERVASDAANAVDGARPSDSLPEPPAPVLDQRLASDAANGSDGARPDQMVPEPAAAVTEPTPAAEGRSAGSVGQGGDLQPGRSATQAVESTVVTPAATELPTSSSAVAASQETKTSAPSFDIVRVEPTGEAVIAGRAPGGATVQVLSNGQVVAEAAADAGGAWVALPSSPLVAGTHDLSIRAVTDSGEATASEQRVAVSVPQQPDEEVVAVLDRPGQASEILSGPEGAGNPGAYEPQKLKPLAAAAQVGTAGAEASALQAPIISVDAVEAEGRTVFVAGAGDAGALVRVYLDDELIGQAQAGAGGRWLVEAIRPLDEGKVVVRADQVQAGSAQVEARAEVPFVRRLDMASLVPVAGGGSAGADASADRALPSPSAVIIRRGDNLWTISRRTYGRGTRYTTIYEANAEQIRDPHWIYPGQVFTVPTRDRGWADN